MELATVEDSLSQMTSPFRRLPIHTFTIQILAGLDVCANAILPIPSRLIRIWKPTMSRRAPNAAADRAAQNQTTVKSLLKLEGNKSCADCKRNKRMCHLSKES